MVMHRNPLSTSSAAGGSSYRRNALGALAIAFAVAILAGCSGGVRQARKSSPTPEEAAYVKNIQLTPGRVTAAQNFLQHTVTTLHGTVTNKGGKTVLYLQINLTFSGIDGKPIGQEQAWPVSGHTLPLKPGETRSFQKSFDQVPAGWNQAPPTMTVSRLILVGEP